MTADLKRLELPPNRITRDFLNGGGNTGAQMRAHDWSASPLGAPETFDGGLPPGMAAIAEPFSLDDLSDRIMAVFAAEA